jgi:hypothetical protein
MMNPAELTDKLISIIVWNTEQDNDVHVYLGKLKVEQGEYYFLNEEKGWRIHLDAEQRSRLRPVSIDLQEMLLHADYALSMTIGQLPESGSQDYKDKDRSERLTTN